MQEETRQLSLGPGTFQSSLPHILHYPTFYLPEDRALGGGAMLGFDTMSLQGTNSTWKETEERERADPHLLVRRMDHIRAFKLKPKNPDP